MAARPTKRRKLTPSLGQQQNGPSIQKSFFKSAANWSLEADYAARRKRSKKESNKLPIKTYDGRIQQGDAYLEREEVEIDEEWLNGADVAQSSASEDDPLPKPEKSERELVKEAKEELAKIATAINEEPEENAAGFKAMAKVGQSDSVAVQKLSLVTQMAVYKDVIPGYRIRPILEEAKEEKVSKEVRRLRNYEQTLVTSYQAYIKELARCSKLDPSTKSTLPSVAITCACTLVTIVPHFNFRGDLLRILVGKLSKLKADNDFVKCRRALQTLFQNDEDGAATMEAVSLLGKMMKAREYRVDESVLNLFLHLRLLSEYTGKASQDQAGDLNGASRSKLSKKNRQFRTKRQRKQLKEEKALEKDMALADAQVNHEERENMQSETLKLVFATYFRILKLRLPRLMGAVLEGLAKYAHLINMDFFGDLLEAMRDLIKHAVSDEEAVPEIGTNEEEDEDITTRNTSREALLCTVTAFALLESQDASKARSDPQLDLPFFQNHLYQTLFPLSVNNDLELTSKSSHQQSPVSANDPLTTTSREYKVNLQTTTVLLLRSLTAVLLPTFNSRAVPAARLAAFIKQLATISLHLPEKSARAVLGLLSDLVCSHGRKVSALWNTEERIRDGKFRPLAPTPESSNPFAATVWEGELLRRHYCPEVREGVKMLEKAVGGAGS